MLPFGRPKVADVTAFDHQDLATGRYKDELGIATDEYDEDNKPRFISPVQQARAASSRSRPY